MMKNRLLILFLPLLLSVVPAAAKGLSAEKRKEISQMLTRILDREVAGCKTNVTQVVDAGNRLTLYASIGMSYYPFRERSVAAIYDSIRSLLPASLARRRLSLVTDKHPIEELIPQIYRSGSRGKPFTNRSDRPLVTRLSSPVKPTHGLAGRHIAMWQSHGRYFDQEENRWRWQRSRLGETCEDLYTQSYVLPYLVPMLERAGANVLLPRERDVQTEEAIADNDAGVDEGSSYVEFTGDRRWFDAGTGFAHRREVYVECQNPFAEGTARGVQTVTDGRESRAEWSADLPASGEYAVYVSYKTVERSSEDALYTVRHLGGESRFAVNQTMGGGTWIYLGTFRFAAGQNPALQRRPHACCGVPHAGYRLFLRAERLSPFLRGRPLLAAMGGISRNGLPPEGRARRLQGGLHVARPLGQRAHGRRRTAARRRGSEHSRRHGAGLPLRRRRAPQRRDDRHAGHLLHTGERRPLRWVCQPLPVA